MSTPPQVKVARSLLPHPVLSVLLAVVWLLLQQSVAVAQCLTAIVLGWGIPMLLRSVLPPPRPVPRAWGTVVRLMAIVLWDIVRSNLTVARLALSPRACPQPAWLRLPLELTDERAKVWLAAIITMTPGTVSCVVDESRREIIIHALDCDNPEEAVRDMKQRYERPLKEIFG